MRQLKLDTTTVPFAINRPVRIIASGGMGADYFGLIALTGATTSKGGGLQTVIRVIDPETGALVQKNWRTDFLEELGEDKVYFGKKNSPQKNRFELSDEEIEEIGKIRCAIAHSKREISGAPIPPETLSKVLQCATSSQELAECKSGIINNIDTSKLNESSQSMPAVRQGIQVAQLQPEVLLPQMQKLEPAVKHECGESKNFISIRDDSERDSARDGEKSKSGFQSLEERGNQIKNCSKEESNQRTQRQLEGWEDISKEGASGIHSGEVSRPPKSKTSRGSCTSTHSSNGKALGQIPELLRPFTPRERSSTSHQSQYARQPNRESSVDEAGGTHQISQQREQAQMVKASHEIRHEGSLFIDDRGSQGGRGTLLCHSQSSAKRRKIIWGLLGICQNLDTLIYFLGWADSLWQPTSLEDLKQLNSLKSQKTQKQSCDRAIPISPSTQISETIIHASENLIYLQLDFLAREHPQPEPEPDLTILNQPSGEKPCAVSVSDDPDLSLWNSLKDLSNEDFEQSLEDSEWQGIVATLRSSYQQRNSELCTKETEFLSCPTLTSGSKTEKSRAAGTTKCERWFKQQGLIPPGYQLSAPAMAVLMGLPEDLFNPLCPPQADQAVESALVTLQDEQSHQAKLRSPLAELHTSIALSDELTPDEERDRHDLERKVESAFVKAESVFREAVFALKEIRDRKLYRSSHATFEEYCKDRFNFKRARPYQLINAANVLENLENPDLQMSTNFRFGRHLLPTNERQIRDLVDLSPEEQVTVWGKAITQNKIPSGAKIKDTMEAHIREHLSQPPTPTYVAGDVVEIRSGGHSSLREHDGMWGIVTEVLPCRYKVYISLRNTEVRCKGNELEKVKADAQGMEKIIAVGKRASTLLKTSDKLNHAAIAVLDTLGRQTCFSPDDLWLLEQIEQRFQVNNDTIEV